MIPNPLADTAALDADADLVAAAQAGSRDALEQLVARHQSWIYNIVLRMTYDPHDAEDITQEILIKLVTKLSLFEGRSRFRTWLYRLVVNHVLNMRRTKAEEWEWTFEKYGSGLRSAPDEELPDPNTVPVDLQLLVEEAKIGHAAVGRGAVIFSFWAAADRQQRPPVAPRASPGLGPQS